LEILLNAIISYAGSTHDLSLRALGNQQIGSRETKAIGLREVRKLIPKVSFVMGQQ